MDLDLIIALSLFTIGFLYASVGHGGASGYLAALSLFSLPISFYKPWILVLNIAVAGISFIQFSRTGNFKWKLCWPFIITSIPCAFLGSKLKIEGDLYNILLGIALLIPTIRLLGLSPAEKSHRKEIFLPLALLCGAFIGFLSGMLSIGGGIFLSPVLILLAWADNKEAAAVSSLFIVLNSISGLLGHSAPIQFTESTMIWFLAAASGGFLGAYFGSHKFAQTTIRYSLTLVLAIASVKLIFFM